MATFVSLVAEGKAAPEEVEDFVQAWHDSGEAQPSLQDALGMTTEEYAAWMLNPDVLLQVVASRQVARRAARG